MRPSYFHKALIVAAIAIFYTNVPAYVYDHYRLTVLEAPKEWIILFCLLSLPVLLRQRAAWNALKSPVMVWCLGYALVTVLWFFLSSQSDMAWQEVRNRFLGIIEIVAFLMVFWHPTAVRLARQALVAGVLLGVALNIYELFIPMTFSQELGRSAGLYGNPTQTGEALVLGMILSVTVLEPRYRGPFILLTGIGILTTFSRGGILAWVIAVAGLILVGRLSLKDFLISGVLGLLLGVLVLLPRWDQLLTTWERTGVLNANVQERLMWFTDPVGVSDHSGWERKHLAQRAWDRIAERPFLGSGTGSSLETNIPPHNQYLSFMLDHGLIGAMILPLLIFAATWGAQQGERRCVAIVFGCVILVLSLFTHTILNTGYSLILLSLMATMATMSRDRESQGSVTMETTEGRTAKVLVGA